MNFNGKFWHKPGHLGMTTEELKEALQGGGGQNTIVTFKYNADEETFTSTETFSSNELKAAADMGKLFFVLINDEDMYTLYAYPEKSTPNGGLYRFYFLSSESESAQVKVMTGSDPDAKYTWTVFL